MQAAVVLVVLALVAGECAANERYTKYPSACLDDKSWAAALHNKLLGKGARDQYVVEEVYIGVGKEFSGDQCVVDAEYRVKLTGSVSEHSREWLDDSRKLADDSQFMQVLLDEPTSPIQFDWRWDEAVRMFELGVREVDPNAPAAVLAKSRFHAQDRGCASALPLTMHNADNAAFKCATVALFPSSCERQLGLRSRPRDFQLKIGRFTGVSSEQSSVGCEYLPTTYAAQFTLGAIGADEEDRSFHPLKAVSKGQDLEQVGADWEERGVLSVQPVRDLEGASDKPFPPGKLWGFRSSRGEIVDPQTKSTLYRTSSPSSPSRAQLLAQRNVLQLTVAMTPELRALLQSTLSAHDGRSGDMEQDLPVGMDLGRVVDAGVMANAGSHADSGDVVAFTLRKEGAKLRQCTEGLGDSDWGAGDRSGSEWEELVSQKLTSIRETAFCVAISPMDTTSSDDSASDAPCAYLRQLYEAQGGDQRSIKNSLFVAPGKLGEGESCETANYEPTFSLTLKHDAFGRGEWKMATPSGSSAHGKDWSWRVTASGAEVGFQGPTANGQEVFELTECGSAQDTWKGGLLMTKKNPKQSFDCLKLSLTPDVCQHALGLGTDKGSHVMFEGSLAATVTPQGNCDYLASFRAFSAAFTNEAWGTGGEGEWNKIEVDGELVTVAGSWRWRATEKGVVLIAFDVADDPSNPSATSTVSFRAPEPCRAGSYPNLNAAWELRTRNEDAHFTCLKLSTNAITTSAFFKQSDAFELMIDMQHNPFHNDDGKEGDEDQFGEWERKHQDFKPSDYGPKQLKTEFGNELRDVRVGKAVAEATGEAADLYRSTQHGLLTHCPLGKLPFDHPVVLSGKTMHAHGMSTRAVFVRNPRHKADYTGLMSRDKTPLLVRYSPSNMHSAAFLPGWSFKFFRDEALPSDDVVAYFSFQPQTSCDALRNPVSNVPVEAAPLTGAALGDPASKFDPYKRFVMETYLEGEVEARAAFNEEAAESVRVPAVPQATRVGITALFLSDADAWVTRNRAHGPIPAAISNDVLARTRKPEALVFVPDEQSAALSREAADVGDNEDQGQCAKHRQRVMQKQLGAFKPRTALFHVYEFSPRSGDVSTFKPSPTALLGTIVTQDTFVESWYGDAVTRYHHEPYDWDDAAPSAPRHPHHASGGVSGVDGGAAGKDGGDRRDVDAEGHNESEGEVEGQDEVENAAVLPGPHGDDSNANAPQNMEEALAPGPFRPVRRLSHGRHKLSTD